VTLSAPASDPIFAWRFTTPLVSLPIPHPTLLPFHVVQFVNVRKKASKDPACPFYVAWIGFIVFVATCPLLAFAILLSLRLDGLIDWPYSFVREGTQEGGSMGCGVSEREVQTAVAQRGRC